MVQLTRDPQVVRLAKDLGLSGRGDCVSAIREYALAHIDRIVREAPGPIDSLAELQWFVGNKFSVKLEVIREDGDIDRIAAEHSEFHPMLRERLVVEFERGRTEGITLERDELDPRIFRYLAVVDGRGDRAVRVYFTAWHELAHLLVHPPQLSFPGFRRTPAASDIRKDALESVVDHVAGKVAFYAPLFRPALGKAIASHGGLTFSALDDARESAAPTASLFATAMGSIHLVESAMVFVAVDLGLKAAERRLTSGPQQTFDFAIAAVEEKLRLTAFVANDHTAASGIAIRRNMRVPSSSVLAAAFRSADDIVLGDDEDQCEWETTDKGALTALPIRVEAVRRGRYVYGLISPR